MPGDGRLIPNTEVHRIGEETIAVRRHSVRQGLAWTIAADLVRRHPGICRVVEGHPHMYDTVSVFACDQPGDHDRWRLIVHMNKELGGHLTHASWFGNGEQERLNWLDVLLAENPRTEIVEPLERIEDLPSPKSTPSTTEWSIGPRVLGAFAQRVMFSPAPWVLLNGMIDGDYGAAERDWLFDQFPKLTEPRAERRSDDFMNQPEWRYWFVVQAYRPEVEEGKASLAIDTVQGLAYTSDEVIDLMSVYKSTGRKVDAVVNAVCPPAF